MGQTHLMSEKGKKQLDCEIYRVEQINNARGSVKASHEEVLMLLVGL